MAHLQPIVDPPQSRFRFESGSPRRFPIHRFGTGGSGPNRCGLHRCGSHRSGLQRSGLHRSGPHRSGPHRSGPRRLLSGILALLLLYLMPWTAFSGVVSEVVSGVLSGVVPGVMSGGAGQAVVGFPGAVAHAAANDDVPPEMQARAEAVFARLADAVAPEHDIYGNYTIQVVREKVPNAWINQDNEIFVSTGLMELLVTDDQLAGVLGHEIAHGTMGHIPHRISQSLWSAFAVLALGVVSGSSGDADWGGLLHMRDLFMFAFSRDQEAEADLVGMGYARAAGYEAEGLVEALQLMDRERRKLPSDSPWQELYRTHPPIPQRVSDLRFVLTSERVLRRPSASMSMGLTSHPAAATAEEAAIAFVQALMSRDVEAAERLLLRGSTSQESVVAQWLDAARANALRAGGPAVDAALDAAAGAYAAGDAAVHGDVMWGEPTWVSAVGEVLSRGSNGDGLALGFDETLVVRLVLSVADAHDVAVETVVSPAFTVTVRRSAVGWSVVAWDIVSD